jgi:hypothetical protein
VPRCVAEGSRELHAAGGILGVQRIGILDEQICVEQFVEVFVGIWRGGPATRKWILCSSRATMA